MKRVFLSLLVVLVSQLFGFSQGDSKLDIGKKVSKTINLKDKHSYTVFLEKGHFALVNLKQQGIDVKIVTYDPLGNKLEEFDSQNGSKGDELILLDALQEGAYRFEVIPLGEVKRERKGTYEIELVAINNAVESHLSQTIEHLNQRNYLPGFAITVVDKNKIRYKNAIGYANREHKVPYSMETVQGIASISKTFIGISLMLLVEEGKLDLNAPVTKYVTDLKGTAWDNVSILNLANHTAGLDHEETNSSILDPNGVFLRFVRSALGTTLPDERVEDWREVLKDVQPLEQEQPGERFRYSSLNTQVMGMVIENVTNKRWSDVVEERIWGKVGARMPLMVHLAPDSTPLNMAIMSSTLEDFAKYATLFTPSWDKVAHEQVVTPSLLEQIRGAGDPAAFKGGAKEGQAVSLFAEKPLKSAYQFDFIFEDGAMYKHGNTGQGIYVDHERDFAAVYFGATPYVAPYGEIKAPAYFRQVAEMLDKAK